MIDLTTTKEQASLLKILKNSVSRFKDAKSLSIIPTDLKEGKGMLIQEKPFLELQYRSQWTQNHIKGAPFVLFYPNGNVEGLKPLLSIMVRLIQNDVPFIIMPYKGKIWYFLSLRFVDINNYSTLDPEIFLDRISKDFVKDYMPDYALSSFDSYVNEYIMLKKEPIPRDMKPSSDHEVVAL